MCDDRVILYAKDALRYAEDHRSMIAEWARSEKVVGLGEVVKRASGLRKKESKMSLKKLCFVGITSYIAAGFAQEGPDRPSGRWTVDVTNALFPQDYADLQAWFLGT